jgi:predicted transcriptional regulator
MIAQVFESYTYNEIQKVKKIVKESELEEYYDTVNRTERVYEPPTGVSHCLHCGARLVSTMWKYSASGKYLCPDCWYRRTSHSQREEYRKQAQKMSTGGYSYRTVTDKVKKTRTVIKSREIEAEEPVTKNGIKIVYPIDIHYVQENKVFRHRVPNYRAMSNVDNHKSPNKQYFKDDIIQNDSNWYDAHSYENAVHNFIRNKQIEKSEKLQIFNLGPIMYNEVIVDEKQVLEEFVDVVGFYPNVPAYIQGHPLDMYNNKRKNIVNIDKVVTIYCNLAIDSKADYGHYKNRGLIIYNFIDYLIENDYKVNLKLLDASFICGETIIQEFEPLVVKNIDLKNPDIYKMKEEHNKIMGYLYNLLTSLSFYRVLLLENKAQIIQENNLRDEWFDGFGYCIKNDDLRELLKIDDEIIIGDPFEHGVNGLFMDDDFCNLMDSIGINKSLYDEDVEFISELPEVETIQEAIENRKIKKLIHFTASSNIDSITKLGILPKSVLENEKINFHQNDFQRLDHHTDAICLSVTEPNIYLFSEYSKRNPSINYKIVEIDPKILYEVKENDKEIRKIFSDYNAASRYSKTSEIDMNIMFQDRIRRKANTHTREGKDLYHPTSAQAEILFFGKIPAEYIINVKDFDLEQAKDNVEKGKTISSICKEIGNITAGQAHNLLVSKGYLKSRKKNSKTVYEPTKKGESIGITLQERKSKSEKYFVNVYNKNAENVIKNLFS